MKIKQIIIIAITLVVCTGFIFISESNPPSEEPGDVLYGIDISADQENEILSIHKNTDSLSFIICKATGGITIQDPDFKLNWKQIHDKGFIAGAYHFYYSHDSPQAQVNNYLNEVGEFAATDLPPIVDFEGYGIDTDQSLQEVQNSLKKVLELIQIRTGRTPIIYTNVSIGNKYLTDAEFAKYPLWIADYNGRSKPEMPGAWKDTEWVLWQQTSKYIINGDTNDLDLFNGDLQQFKDFINKY